MEYMGYRFDDATGKREASHTRYDLPSRDERIYLKFNGIHNYGGIAEAHFSAPDGQPYSFSKDKLDEALRAEVHERNSGMESYELPWFVHASNQLRYRQAKLNRENRVEAVTHAGATSAWYLLSRVGGTAVAVAALQGIASVWSDRNAEAPFNQAVSRSVAGTRFAVSLHDHTAATGSPETEGYSWDFAVSPHKACRVVQEKPSESWLIRKLGPVYMSECRPVVAWPEASAPQQLYAPAFTAYLQAAKPDNPPQIDQVRRALQGKRAADAIQLP